MNQIIVTPAPVAENKLVYSPMNYIGGKKELISTLLDKFPKNINRFVDLFTGGCTVGINSTANEIICNDNTKEVIDLYNYFKDNDLNNILNYLDNRINELGLSRDNKEAYDKLKILFNSNHHPLDFFLCIAHGFSNQIQFNKNKEFRTSFGKRTFNPRMRQNLINFVNTIHNKNISFINKDFRELSNLELTTDDFVYLDPPYFITDTTTYKHGWTEENEIDLIRLLTNLHNGNIRFALSNVLTYKGKINNHLDKFIKLDGIKTIYLDKKYVNRNGANNYNDEELRNSTQEVLVINY